MRNIFRKYIIILGDMMAQKGFLKNFLSYISYKESKEAEDFYIPEIAEETKDTEKAGFSKTEEQKVHSNTDSKQRGIIKPVPITEAKQVIRNEIEADDSYISTTIQSNIKYLLKAFNAPINKDFIIREFTIDGKFNAFIAFLDGMVDRVTINNFILRPLLHIDNSEGVDLNFQVDFLLNNVLETNQVQEITRPTDAIYEILSGNTCLYVEGLNYYLSCETKGFSKRSVEKPQTEGVVRGPQEAFNEDLRTNVTLIRRIIKDSNLTTEFIKAGKRNNNQCAIMYINGLVNPAIVKEVERRIKGIRSDMVFGDGMLEQFIEDSAWTFVPTIMNTERPDRTASHILEGRVAIISDGSPYALIVPVTFHSFLHTPEETNLRWPFGTFIRTVRVFAIFVATLLPALYIGLIGFHREMIPTDLMIAIVSAKENVPFPTFLEILLMELSFELIREAGIRIPGIIGNTLGIIGALILGQAAVQANIVSPVLIIVVAVTGLGNFAIPNFSVAFAVRIIRFAFIIGAAVMGFYGICLVLITAMALLVNMKSFGVPFLSITAPKTNSSGDLFVKKPVWKQELRPDSINPLDKERQPEISRKWMQEDAVSEEMSSRPKGKRDNND